MQFTTINESEYLNFWNNYQYRNFLSLPYIAEYRKKHGWSVEYVGIKHKKQIIASAMLLSRTRRFNKKEYYCPRGPLVDYSNTQLLNFFLENIKNHIKRKNAYTLRIDPYVIYKQRDINGDIVDGGIDNDNIVHNILNNGFKKVPLNNAEQDSWFFSLDLANKDENTILKEMKANTRNLIKKAEKSHITVKEIEYNELDKFYDIELKTSIRKGFKAKPLSYFQEMYQLLYPKKQIKFLLAEINLGKLIDEYKKEIIVLIEKEKKLSINSTGKRENIKENINTLKQKIIDCENIISKEGNNIIALASAMFLTIQPEIIYSYSGSYDEYMNFNGQYLIQWEMIKYGIKNGYPKYNFYGIPAYINTKPKEYGIYKFKKGFNGYVEELIGEFELPISKSFYIIKIIQKVKKILRGSK